MRDAIIIDSFNLKAKSKFAESHIIMSIILISLAKTTSIIQLLIYKTVDNKDIFSVKSIKKKLFFFLKSRSHILTTESPFGGFVDITLLAQC